MYCFEKFMKQPDEKGKALWYAPMPFGLLFAGTFILLTGGNAIFIFTIFLPIFFYWILLKGKHDTIMEKFDKEPQDKKDRDNILIFCFYTFSVIYFFSIIFIYGPEGRK
jgi:hypothetical protein